MVQVRDVPGLAPDPEAAHRHVIGWLVPAEERKRLLEQFAPAYERTVADHVTLKAGVVEDAPPPPPVEAEVVGVADDGKGVQALVVRIDGSTERPGGGVWHITWSLGQMRKAKESNDVIAREGWRDLDEPVPVRLEPGRFYG
ncbi:MAG TPA: hypothetical protein VEA15_03455 [Caulobacteraceae bacterium]|nr:hypothetical protein [Caulobacteraceae bacterium]